MLAATDSEGAVAASSPACDSSPARDAAAEVLRELIDARLLTSYEVREDEHEPIRRVEIIHESLLANWPRLVRWQTQDQEGAQLRDELRQSARAWDEHGRHDDRLWTGTAYREFQLWRERYPGGLTEVEEAFGAAMTSYATRRKRRRRIASTAAAVIVIAVAVVFANLWRRSVAGTRRAEASELVALGQLELESYPSSTVAHAIASLALADSETARLLALRALWAGPTAFVVSEDPVQNLRFSPDGRSLVKGVNLLAQVDESALTIYKPDGSTLPLAMVHEKNVSVGLSWISPSGHFVSWAPTTNTDTSLKIAVWSVERQTPLVETTVDSSDSLVNLDLDSRRERLILFIVADGVFRVDALGFDGATEHLGTLDFAFDKIAIDHSMLTGDWFAVAAGNRISVIEIAEHELAPPRFIGVHDGVLKEIHLDPLRRFVVSVDEDGRLVFWSLTGEQPPQTLTGPSQADFGFAGFESHGTIFWAAGFEDDNWICNVWDTSGDRPRFRRSFDFGGSRIGNFRLDPAQRFIARSGPDTNFRVWPMNAPIFVDPLLLRRGKNLETKNVKFNPTSPWLATADLEGSALWPLAREYPWIIRHHKDRIYWAGICARRKLDGFCFG